MTTPKLVTQVSDALARRVDRRGFLGRAAVAGSALAVNPVGYLLKPISAYTAICSCAGQDCDCGAACCDGYTEFCCTLTGSNTCPQGTLTAGWWKVDGSSFCGGGPRYYLDCNAGCGTCGCGASGVCGGECSGTGCGCAHGNCGNRKAGCTLFRYGQCNQAVACVGPIVCRVVTCVPPWQIDGSCTTAPRTDENTRYHDAPCLHEDVDPRRPFGNLDAVTTAPGRVTVSGWAIDPDTTGPIEVHAYIDGHFAGWVYANQARPDVQQAYPSFGPNHGFTMSLAVGEGAHTICVYAINVGGVQNPALGCRPFTIGGPPIGNLDAATAGPGTVTVSGWALDPDTTSPIEVHVYIDGRFAGWRYADQYRPDVQQAYPSFGPYHGFAITVAASPGAHNVCAYAVNVGSSPVNPSLGCRTLTVGGPPVGNLDAVTASSGGRVVVDGWALDPDTAAPVEVHVYVDGRFAGWGYADRPRADVAQLYPAYGDRHGFNLSVPATPGVRTVCAYAINVGGSPVNPSLGCRTLTVT